MGDFARRVSSGIVTILSFVATLITAVITGSGVASAAPACGDTITGTVKLTADLDCSGTAVSPALTLAARAKLDLGGKTVTCAPGGTGIDLSNRFSSVTNGKVTGCDTAVLVRGLGNHAVRKVKADGNDVGIAATSGLNSQLTDNIITGGDSGITLGVGADATRVERNHVTGCQGSNIRIDSDRNFVRTNTANGSVTGSGIAIAGDRNKLVGNITSSNGADGLVVLGGFHNKSFRTTANGNARGIAVANGSLETRVVQNSASGNTVADLFDDIPPPPCETSWVRNVTASSTVGGAGAACIK